MDVEQNLRVKHVAVTGIGGTWIQTEDGDSIYSLFLYFSVNGLLIIDKITLLSSLVTTNHFALNGALQIEPGAWADPGILERGAR